jgi:hypothetical protein
MFGNFKRPASKPVPVQTRQSDAPAVSGMDGTPAASEAVIKKPQAGQRPGVGKYRSSAARGLMR